MCTAEMAWIGRGKAVEKRARVVGREGQEFLERVWRDKFFF